ncbi:hypothetical protein RND81_10G176900 [Saponaria officinalis]|uniref:CTLH domain-containing protein n=1 Tax=Saponaria officinalis TaxID=3572 RepID=A0AAW1I2Y5_SAPOF
MLTKDIVFWILQLLKEEEKFEETVHMLEQESGLYFDMTYFEDLLTNGAFEEVEKYLSGFTKLEDNINSQKIFFEIRKQKYYEALDRRDFPKAHEILNKDLKVLSRFDEDQYKELKMLLPSDDFRENENLSNYGDTKSARANLSKEVCHLIKNNPLFQDKLSLFSRIQTLIDQSLRSWQGQQCYDQRPNVARMPSPVINPLLAHEAACVGSSQKAASSGPSHVMNFNAHSIAASMARRPTTATDNPTTDHKTVDSDLVPKRSGQFGSLAEINDPPQLRVLLLADRLMVKPVRLSRIMRLVYTNSGGALLALTYNGVHKLWKWQKNDSDVAGKATFGVDPQLWMPSSGVMMTNHIMSANTKEPCLAISKNDSYVMSSSGGEISLFNMHTFETVTKFMHPPPMATALAIHPADNNLLAIGMDDSRILLYNVQVLEVKGTLTGHTQRVTGLAFSNHPSVLVSSGADSQLFVWNLIEQKSIASKFFRKTTPRHAPTRVQFQHDLGHVLVIHETQLAIYEDQKLEHKKEWFPGPWNLAITDATYTCDGQSVVVSLLAGRVYVLIASTLALRCTINQTVFLPRVPSYCSNKTYPTSVAAHPSQPNQFALGLSNGSVFVLELVSDSKWGTLPPSENEAAPHASSSN